MGKVSDYISSLEHTQIDPVVMASTLLALHEEEMEYAGGKIAKLETDLTASNTIIAERDSSLVELRAKAWELANRVPTNNQSKEEKQSAEDANESNEDAQFEDFFEED